MIQWPPHSKIICLNSKDEIIAESKRSRLDLSDSLMLWNNTPFSCSIEPVDRTAMPNLQY